MEVLIGYLVGSIVAGVMVFRLTAEHMTSVTLRVLVDSGYLKKRINSDGSEEFVKHGDLS